MPSDSASWLTPCGPVSMVLPAPSARLLLAMMPARSGVFAFARLNSRSAWFFCFSAIASAERCAFFCASDCFFAE